MWPSEIEYDHLFRSPGFEKHLCPELASGKAERNRGRVFTGCGTYGRVFCLQHVQRGDLACKVYFDQPTHWLDPAEVVERYTAIAAHLKRNPMSLLLPVGIFEDGIRIDERWFPLITTPWIGKGLVDYIEGDWIAYLRPAEEESDPLNYHLARQFALGMCELERAEVAHGDICPDNMVVVGTPDGPRLRLIDYDNMFVPALLGRERPSAGSVVYLRDFMQGRSPARQEAFGPHGDRAAAAITLVQLFLLTPQRYKRYPGHRPWLLNVSDPMLKVELESCGAAWRALYQLYEDALASLVDPAHPLPSMSEFVEHNPAFLHAIRRREKAEGVSASRRSINSTSRLLIGQSAKQPQSGARWSRYGRSSPTPDPPPAECLAKVSRGGASPPPLPPPLPSALPEPPSPAQPMPEAPSGSATSPVAVDSAPTGSPETPSGSATTSLVAGAPEGNGSSVGALALSSGLPSEPDANLVDAPSPDWPTVVLVVVSCAVVIVGVLFLLLDCK